MTIILTSDVSIEVDRTVSHDDAMAEIDAVLKA